VELAVQTDVLTFEEGADLLDAFLEACHALIHRDAEVTELVGQEGAGKAGVKPSTADRVEHGKLTGELQGVIERRQHGTSYQPCLLGAL
jgi:hypothetical protein